MSCSNWPCFLRWVAPWPGARQGDQAGCKSQDPPASISAARNSKPVVYVAIGTTFGSSCLCGRHVSIDPCRSRDVFPSCEWPFHLQVSRISIPWLLLLKNSAFSQNVSTYTGLTSDACRRRWDSRYHNADKIKPSRRTRSRVATQHPGISQSCRSATLLSGPGDRSQIHPSP